MEFFLISADSFGMDNLACLLMDVVAIDNFELTIIEPASPARLPLPAPRQAAPEYKARSVFWQLVDVRLNNRVSPLCQLGNQFSDFHRRAFAQVINIRFKRRGPRKQAIFSSLARLWVAARQSATAGFT
ncbi:hypothetical protein ACNKHU_23840 [Shigella flexneri]